MAKLILQNQTEPASPDAGCTTLYIDSDGKLKYKDANGTVYRLTTNRDCIIGDLLLVGGGGGNGCNRYCGSSTSPYGELQGGGAGGCVSENCGIFLPNSACVIIGQGGAGGGDVAYHSSSTGCTGGTTCFGAYYAGGGVGGSGGTGGAGVCGGGSGGSGWGSNGTAGYCSNITIDGQFCTFAGGGGGYKRCSGGYGGCSGCADIGYCGYGVGGGGTNNATCGHSGVVILRYATSVPICATGGTITCCNGYVVHTFTEDGMFCITCVY